jgi:hypothetical protein
MVDGGARSIHKVIKDLLEGQRFTVEGVPINKVSSMNWL